VFVEKESMKTSKKNKNGFDRRSAEANTKKHHKAAIAGVV
jgi:hypothetical protein